MNTSMLNIRNYIKQERIDACLVIWKKFDKGNTGFIKESDLVGILRVMDYNPTDKAIGEMKEMIKSDDPKANNELISQAAFFACVAKLERETDSIEEFINCFKLWDPQNTGGIDEKTFRYIMCNMGDKLANDEMENLMKEAAANGFTTVLDEIIYLKYEGFAKFLKGLYKPPPKEDPKKAKKK